MELGKYKNSPTCRLSFEVVYQTRKTVIYHIFKNGDEVEKTTHSGVFLRNFEVFLNVVKHCLKCKSKHPHHCQMCLNTVLSQSKLKLRRERRNTIVKIHANKISKHLHGHDLLCLNYYINEFGKER